MTSTTDKLEKTTRWNKVSVLGVGIDALSLDQLLVEIGSYLLHRKSVVISYANVHAMNIAYTTPWFRTFLNESA